MSPVIGLADTSVRSNHRTTVGIARHVATSIADGDSIMMDTGTTTSILARALLDKRGLTIVTNSSDVARTLATVNGNKVYMAGGELHGDNGAAFGRTAIDFVRHFRVRHAIISIAAIDIATGPMDYHLAEADFARTVLGCASQSTLPALARIRSILARRYLCAVSARRHTGAAAKGPEVCT